MAKDMGHIATLGDILPMINVRFVAVNALYDRYSRKQTLVDCEKRERRESLFRWRKWEIRDIHASVRQDEKGCLWPVLIVSVTKPAKK